MVSLVGRVSEGQADHLTDLFLREHRRNFDNPSREIDPAQSVVENIRKTGDYKRIHKLRPESVDERDWISERLRETVRGGLQTDQQEDFAIAQATAGGDVKDIAEAAATQQFQVSGQAPDIIRNEMLEATRAMFAGVVR